MTPTNAAAVKPTIKKQRAPSYGVWTFPSSAEAAAAFIPPPTHPLLAAVPRPQRLAPQPKAAE